MPLVILAMEALSNFLKRAREGGFISGLKVGGKAIMRQNLTKSKLIPINGVPNGKDLASLLGSKIGRLLTTYLPPLDASFKLQALKEVRGRKIHHEAWMWKRQYLSKHGRLTLIKNMLSGLPIYCMSLLVIPKKMCLRPQKIQRDFIWEEGAHNKNVVR